MERGWRREGENGRDGTGHGMGKGKGKEDWEGKGGEGLQPSQTLIPGAATGLINKS